MPLTVTVNTIAECLRPDCNSLGDEENIVGVSVRALCLATKGHIIGQNCLEGIMWGVGGGVCGLRPSAAAVGGI